MEIHTSPQEELVHPASEEVATNDSKSVEDLIEMTKSLPKREQLICQGLILRSLENKDSDAYNSLFSELSLQSDQISELNDVELQSIYVRSFRKSNQAVKQQMGSKESLNMALTLLKMTQKAGRRINDTDDMQKECPPLTASLFVDAHIEAAKLLFAISRQNAGQVRGLSADTLLQLALFSLLSALRVFPQMDIRLGNPKQLPYEPADYAIYDVIGTINSGLLEADPLAFALKLEEEKKDVTSEGGSTMQSFHQYFVQNQSSTETVADREAASSWSASSKELAPF